MESLEGEKKEGQLKKAQTWNKVKRTSHLK